MGPSPLQRPHRSPPSRPGSRGSSSSGLRKSQSSQGLLVEAAAREHNHRFNQNRMSHSASQGSMGGGSGSCFCSATRSSASSNGSTRANKTRPNNSATLELLALNKQRVRLGLFALDPPIWSTPEEVRNRDHMPLTHIPNTSLPCHTHTVLQLRSRTLCARCEMIVNGSLAECHQTIVLGSFVSCTSGEEASRQSLQAAHEAAERQESLPLVAFRALLLRRRLSALVELEHAGGGRA